jgi:hypothetical protein
VTTTIATLGLSILAAIGAVLLGEWLADRFWRR